MWREELVRIREERAEWEDWQERAREVLRAEQAYIDSRDWSDIRNGVPYSSDSGLASEEQGGYASSPPVEVPASSSDWSSGSSIVPLQGMPDLYSDPADPRNAPDYNMDTSSVSRVPVSSLG
jgi:hypothetical protein